LEPKEFLLKPQSYLAKYVEEKTLLLLKEAKILAEHAKRITVLQEDVKLARKNLNL